MAKAKQVSEVTNGGAEAIEYSIPYTAHITIEGSADFLFHRWNCEAVETKAKAAKNSAPCHRCSRIAQKAQRARCTLHSSPKPVRDSPHPAQTHHAQPSSTEPGLALLPEGGLLQIPYPLIDSPRRTSPIHA